MFWIKLGILLIGFIYAGLLPYTIKKAAEHVNLDLSRETLSFLSNKKLFGEKYVKGYKRLLFATAILTYAFFWLLSKYYDLGEHQKLMQYVDYSCASLTLLAFVPHNIQPYSMKTPATTLQRIIHNLLAVIVFISLSSLVIVFQIIIFDKMRFQGMTGTIIISIVILSTLFSLIRHGVNGVTELIFINGISIWNIFFTIITILS